MISNAIIMCIVSTRSGKRTNFSLRLYADCDSQFACPFTGCGFRANQQGGLKCHVNSMQYVFLLQLFRHPLSLDRLFSENIRLPCGEPGCAKTFSDPSSRSKHIKKFHSTEESSGSSERGRDRQKKNSVAYPVSVHARVARQVEDAKGILATFAVHDPSNPATPSADDAATNHDTRRTSVNRQNYTIPSPRRHPGVFHRANDVPIDRSSIDESHQPVHQTYNVNSRAAPAAWGYYPDLTRPQVRMLTFDQLGHPRSIQGDIDPSRAAAHDQSCRCWDCVVGDLTLAPLWGQQEEDRARREGLPPFSYAGTGHVPRSDQQWVHPPISNDFRSSAYPRPNPRILFDIR